MPSDTRILAVDDREENLTALAAVLDALPVEVVPVTSGQAALKELLSDDFALILLDVVMPEMDGFETAGCLCICQVTVVRAWGRRWRVREVTCPKSRLSGLSRSRWMAES
ncbi:response regulator, partial [Actinomadura sp. KC216]|uniref:response regulator n=1 Tax=Actinomadura sp. KC216 TaxID=2530370 RepID=UPI001FB816CD